MPTGLRKLIRSLACTGGAIGASSGADGLGGHLEAALQAAESAQSFSVPPIDCVESAPARAEETIEPSPHRDHDGDDQACGGQRVDESSGGRHGRGLPGSTAPQSGQSQAARAATW